MAFDYKKEYKEFYLPPKVPTIIKVPKMKYLAVRGKGNPNEENSEYKKSIELLYAIAFTIKMSYKGTYQIEGYFSYVVPPLEGFWWQENCLERLDYNKKATMEFLSVIRLPDFVTRKDFEWAIQEAATKKMKDYSKVEFLEVEEGLCVQCMHLGSYDLEPQTIAVMHEYAEENGYQLDFSEQRLHHEIYLSDPRRCKEESLRTVLRHPIKKKGVK